MSVDGVTNRAKPAANGGRRSTADVEQSRPQRADAAKNRTRLLTAAEEVFATEGVQAQVDQIAERAGLGVGTFYRHFPTKESLIEAIVRARLQSLGDQTAEFAEAGDPGEAFFSFLHEFARQAIAKRDLFEALGEAGVDIKSNCAEEYDQLRLSIDRLLHRAQERGAVRSEITTDEVIGLVAGACHATSQSNIDSGHFERMISIISDGVRAP